MHFGDTHLGRKHPNKISKQRVESSIKALQHCVEKAVEHDLDFVIHAGDVFDTVYPWHSVIEAAKRKLEPLKQNEIPMYVIRGNHDRSYGQGRTLKGLAIDHIENDYIKLIDPSPQKFSDHESGFIDHDENIRIYGLGYHSKKTSSILKDFEPEGEKFNFLLLHDFVEGVTRNYSENVPKADQIAEKDLQYVGIGHDHQPNPRKKLNGTVFAATGGTVDYDFNTTEFGKTFNILEIDSEEGVQNLDTHQIPQELELKRMIVNVEKADKASIRKKLESAISDQAKLAVKLKIIGKMDDGDPSGIPTHRISRELEDEIEGLLMLEINLDLEIEGYEVESSDSDRFSISNYLEENLSDKEQLSSDLQSLHDHTTSVLADDQNLTGSGFNLNQESRENLKRKVERELFE